MDPLLKYIVDHVFLPPKLPQWEDSDPDFCGKSHLRSGGPLVPYLHDIQ